VTLARDEYVSRMSASEPISEAEIWNRTIRPEDGDLSVEGARDWLKLRLSDADRRRVQELSAKAHAGQLTTTEDQELENYLNVGRTLELLKAKARLSLSRHTP
jgi:hypothetical protein